MSPDELLAVLGAALSAVTGAPAEVRGLVQLTGGASRETWSFDADISGRADVPCILQRRRPGAEAAAGIGMEVEAALLGAASDAGVAVPEVLAAGIDGHGCAFTVTERLEGEAIPRKLLRDERFATARTRMLDQCAAALAAIHSIDPDTVGGLHELDQVGMFRQVLDGMGEAHPAFELGFRWLERNRPPAGRRAVVHGDFRTGNLLADPTGLRAVLDWELAHVGDPAEDLGWFCVRAWRFGSGLRAGGWGTAEELLDAYAAHGGGVIDIESLRWWEVLGTLKWGVMCMIQASRHLHGFTQSVELAAIGRRTCENEWDLLELIR